MKDDSVIDVMGLAKSYRSYPGAVSRLLAVLLQEIGCEKPAANDPEAAAGIGGTDDRKRGEHSRDQAAKKRGLKVARVQRETWNLAELCGRTTVRGCIHSRALATSRSTRGRGA